MPLTGNTIIAVDTAQADVVSAHTLLSCLIREVAGPDRQVVIDSGHLLVRLPHIDRLLRVRLRRVSAVGAHRFTGPVQCHGGGDTEWTDTGLDDLADLIDAELTARTGVRNEEFANQVRASRDTLAAMLAARPSAPAHRPSADYVESEQALLAGHPRHPAPKWRSGDTAQWRRYSPETRSAFRMRWLAVPEELIHDHAVHGDFDTHAVTAELLGPARDRVPEGCRVLPVHPWQFALLSDDRNLGPVLTEALAAGALHDLGQAGLEFHPTASVRTLYQPATDLFLKTSLHVRITNCLRKNASYELIGAVELTRVLGEVFAEVSARHPGFTVLPEPAARSVRLPSRYGTSGQRHELLEGLGTIVRTGIGGLLGPGRRAHLAATLAEPHPDPAGTRTRLADLAPGDRLVPWARRWWRDYVRLLVPPVLRLWTEHGVVLEPHLQNIVVVLDSDGLPVRLLARDLEGTKLLAHQRSGTLAMLPADVARSVVYDEERGWNRVAYCLFVNHLTEIAGALADIAPDVPHFEDELWDFLTDLIASTSTELGHPPRLRALLAGVPLPAKANLLLRWRRRADREAAYLPFPNPLGRNSFGDGR
ncbi:IucA/IucC family protein [Amycolatopsis pigmentata]|uniref:IucA/IucC family protein n=1 Tax=Amycolatopsis pigmentata TaxID=450801 RepID=A0ABW5G395_9PSEU